MFPFSDQGPKEAKGNQHIQDNIWKGKNLEGVSLLFIFFDHISFSAHQTRQNFGTRYLTCFLFLIKDQKRLKETNIFKTAYGREKIWKECHSTSFSLIISHFQPTKHINIFFLGMNKTYIKKVAPKKTSQRTHEVYKGCQQPQQKKRGYYKKQPNLKQSYNICNDQNICI